MRDELFTLASIVFVFSVLEILYTFALLLASRKSPSSLLEASVGTMLTSLLDEQVITGGDARPSSPPRFFPLEQNKNTRLIAKMFLMDDLSCFEDEQAKIRLSRRLDSEELVKSFSLYWSLVSGGHGQGTLYQGVESRIGRIEHLAQIRNVLIREYFWEDDMFFARLAIGELLVRDFYDPLDIACGRYFLIDGSRSMDYYYSNGVQVTEPRGPAKFSQISKIHAKAVVLAIMRKLVMANRYPFYLRFFGGRPTEVEVVKNEADALETAMRICQWQKPVEWSEATELVPALTAACADLSLLKIEEGIVLVTDGEIGDDRALVEVAELRSLLGGNGLCVFITGDRPDPVLEQVAKTYVRLPAVESAGEQREVSHV